MSAYGRLAFKDPRLGNWLSNLKSGGTRVRILDPDTDKVVWVTISTANTKVRNPDHKEGTHDVDDPNFPRWTTLVG